MLLSDEAEWQALYLVEVLHFLYYLQSGWNKFPIQQDSAGESTSSSSLVNGLSKCWLILVLLPFTLRHLIQPHLAHIFPDLLEVYLTWSHSVFATFVA